MERNEIIAAEAFIRSNRVGYRSPFDSDISTVTGNTRLFRADPQLVDAAVRALKTRGFTVTTIGKYSIGLLGLKSLYESTFKVVLVLKSNEAGEQLGYQVTDSQFPDIIQARDSPFAIEIDSILLVDQNVPMVANPRRITLEDVQKVLEYPKEILEGKAPPEFVRPTEENKNKVVVIEEGCFTNHSYFRFLMLEYGWSIDSKISEGLLSLKKETFANFYSAVRRLNDLERRGGDFKANPSFGLDTETMDYFLERYKKQCDFIKTPETADAHGTSVVAALTTTLPKKSEVLVLRHALTDYGCSIFDSFKEALSLGGSVINCSFGIIKDPRDLNSRLLVALSILFSEKEEEVLLVFSSGNNKESEDIIQEKINLYSQILSNNVLVVGGAYYSKEGDNAFPELRASKAAYGCNTEFLGVNLSSNPHVSGICGPFVSDYLKVPNYSETKTGEFFYTNGTSIAAPQISGICAGLKAACPAITPEQVKEIIVRTAVPVHEGKTAQWFSFAEIDIRFNDEVLHPGLANYELALFSARYFNLMQKANAGFTIKDAVDLARANL